MNGWNGLAPCPQKLERGVRSEQRAAAKNAKRMPPANQLEIRRARPEDAPEIAAVLRQAFVEFKPLYTEPGFAATALQPDQIIARMAEGPVWIALQETIVLGTVAAVKKDSSVYIRGMGVLPAARGSGTGSRLLQQAEDWARREGIFTLFLSTTPFLHSAIHLYERSGFRRSERGSHDLFGTPLFTMEKIIF